MSYYKGWLLYSTAACCKAVRHGVSINNLTRDLVQKMIDQRNYEERERLRKLNQQDGMSA